MIEPIESIPKRIVKLLKVAQPSYDRSGLLGPKAFRGVFASKNKLDSMNSRMLLSVQIPHTLKEGQYFVNGLCLYRSKRQGFFPKSYGILPKTFNRRKLFTSAPLPAELARFCLDINICLDLTEVTKAMEVIYEDFKSSTVCFLGNYARPDKPILVRVISDGLVIDCFFIPYTGQLEIEEGLFCIEA